MLGATANRWTRRGFSGSGDELVMPLHGATLQSPPKLERDAISCKLSKTRVTNETGVSPSTKRARVLRRSRNFKKSELLRKGLEIVTG